MHLEVHHIIFHKYDYVSKHMCKQQGEQLMQKNITGTALHHGSFTCHASFG